MAEVLKSSASQRVAQVVSSLEQACKQAGRDANEVRLLPVSKKHSLAEVQAVNAELSKHSNSFMGSSLRRLYGENHVQEIVAKSDELTQNDDFGFALIGQLQSNKVNAVAGLIDEFQALDSHKLAAKLDRRLESLGRQLRVLVEVNTSGEVAKHGVPVDEAYDFCASLSDCQQLCVEGLMTVAVNSPDEADVAACFDRLVDLQRRLRDDAVLGSEWAELSMGMSGDFPLAIAHGATTVRIGTALFGARDYSKTA